MVHLPGHTGLVRAGVPPADHCRSQGGNLHAPAPGRTHPVAAGPSEPQGRKLFCRWRRSKPGTGQLPSHQGRLRARSSADAGPDPSATYASVAAAPRWARFPVVAKLDACRADGPYFATLEAVNEKLIN